MPAAASERTRERRKITDRSGAGIEREEGGADEDEGEEEGSEEDGGDSQSVMDPPSQRRFDEIHDWSPTSASGEHCMSVPWPSACLTAGGSQRGGYQSSSERLFSAALGRAPRDLPREGRRRRRVEREKKGGKNRRLAFELEAARQSLCDARAHAGTHTRKGGRADFPFRPS